MTGNFGLGVAKFVLKTNQDAMRLYAFLKANREPMMEQGRYLQVVISEYKATRSNEQNAFMWSKGLLGAISEQAAYDGNRYSPEGWNLIFKIMFLPETCAKGVDKWFYPPGDKDRQLVMSTSDLNESEMNLYLHEVEAFATNDLGVMLPVNPRDL
jgi:hypothetical protein